MASKKKINFKPTPAMKMDIDKKLDQWVRGAESPVDNQIEKNLKQNEPERETLYRISIEIPKYLHTRIKKTCAIEQVSIKAKLTKLLLDAFPES